MQFQRKCMIQTQYNGEKPHFGANLDLVAPNSGRQTFFITLVVRPNLESSQIEALFYTYGCNWYILCCLRIETRDYDQSFQNFSACEGPLLWIQFTELSPSLK